MGRDAFGGAAGRSAECRRALIPWADRAGVSWRHPLCRHRRGSGGRLTHGPNDRSRKGLIQHHGGSPSAWAACGSGTRGAPAGGGGSVSPATAKRSWAVARAWLFAALTEPGERAAE
jgi:hypothetical protein